MGLFKKRSTDPEEIDRLKAEIASMGARLDASEAAKTQLDDTVRGITERLDAPVPLITTPPPPVPPPAGAVDGAELEALNDKVDRLEARVDDAPSAGDGDRAELDRIGAEMERIGRRIDDVDARITSISTELANQITELSGDIDGAGAAPADEIVGELRDAQTRLAAEQARYQIAFRQDLADLAERLKRS